MNKDISITRPNSTWNRRLSLLLSGAALLTASAGAVPAFANQAELDIPSMPLNRALKEFGAQAGVSIVFSDHATEGLASTTIDGRYDSAEVFVVFFYFTPPHGKEAFIVPIDIIVDGPVKRNVNRISGNSRQKQVDLFIDPDKFVPEVIPGADIPASPVE